MADGCATEFCGSNISSFKRLRECFAEVTRSKLADFNCKNKQNGAEIGTWYFFLTKNLKNALQHKSNNFLHSIKSRNNITNLTILEIFISRRSKTRRKQKLVPLLFLVSVFFNLCASNNYCMPSI